MKLKISIICAVYNSMEWLEKLITTIPFNLAHEVLFCNDCSTDGSFELLKELTKDYHNVKIFSNEENKGSSYTINKLFDNVTGEYVAIIDSDDYYLEGIREVFAIVDGTYDMYFYNMEVKNGTTIETAPTKNIYSGNFKVIKMEFMGKLRFGDGADGDNVLYQQLLKKEPKELHTGIYAYHYNFPRVGSVNWDYRERNGLDHDDLQ